MTSKTYWLSIVAISAVLITGSLAVSPIAIADDDDDDDDDDDGDATMKFNCNGVGFFFTPNALGQVSTGSWADCSLIGEAALTSFLQVSDADPLDGCTDLASIEDSFLVNEDGFITFSTSGTQCFFDGSGTALAADPVGFCGVGPTQAHTSILTGTYTITDGLVDDELVTGGSGTVDSTADHCGGAPFGNSGTTKIKGTIETVEV